MTVFLRDCSHYDTDVSLAGCVGATHKITEGTSLVDPTYAAHMNAWHKAGVAILGSYHVLHTGNLQAQLDYWLSELDRLTPWWRQHPHWIMQIDGEEWPTDQVSAATIKSFAALAKAKVPHGWVVTYASRGQYGDQLAGIATPLWDAAYGANTGAYPGDGASAWAPYSGQTPVLLQYTSRPHDKDAFRGTVADLQALIEGVDMATLDEILAAVNKGNSWLATLVNDDSNGQPSGFKLNTLVRQTAADVATIKARPVTVTLSDADRTAIAAAVVAQIPAGATVDQVQAAIHTELGKLQISVG